MTRFSADGLALSLPDTLSDQAWGVLGAVLGASAPALLSSLAPRQAPAHEVCRVLARATAPAERSMASTALH